MQCRLSVINTRLWYYVWEVKIEFLTFQCWLPHWKHCLSWSCCYQNYAAPSRWQINLIRKLESIVKKQIHRYPYLNSCDPSHSSQVMENCFRTLEVRNCSPASIKVELILNLFLVRKLYQNHFDENFWTYYLIFWYMNIVLRSQVFPNSLFFMLFLRNLLTFWHRLSYIWALVKFCYFNV